MISNFTGEEITDKNTIVSEYLLKNRSSRITYEENWKLPLSPYHNHLTPMSMQQIDSCGREIGRVNIPINEKKTIGDVCSEYKCDRVVKLKDGVIHGIVQPESKLIQIVGDEFDYRLESRSGISACLDRATSFNVCIRFIKQSPERCLKTPILVEIPNETCVQMLRILVGFAMGEKDRSMFKNFEFESDCIKKTADGKKAIVVRPDNPEIIPVILLNMNISKVPKYGRLSYSYNLGDWKLPQN